MTDVTETEMDNDVVVMIAKFLVGKEYFKSAKYLIQESKVNTKTLV